MKKIVRLFISMCLFQAGGAVHAIDLPNWKYCSEVAIEDNTLQYCRLTIAPQIYDAAKLDLSDIRLLDSAKQQLPYLLVLPKDVSEKHRYSPGIINRSTDADGRSMVTLDFGRQTITTSIEVKTKGDSFRRPVKVEGSNDNVTFFTLIGEAFVFAVTDTRKHRFSNIDLPANDYRYLRITVAPMASEQESPIIEDVMAFKYVRKPAEQTPVEASLVNHVEDEKNMLSIYEYDLNFRNLPIREVRLEFSDKSFYRYATLEGRNAATRKVKIDSEDNRQIFQDVPEPWHSITGCPVYRYISGEGKKCENTTISVPAGSRSYRYLNLKVRNYDDRPLNIGSASVQMTAHQLVFETPASNKAVLYFGNDSTSWPQYDIKQKLARPLEVAATGATLGPVTENPVFGKIPEKPLPWTERNKTLLLAILGAVVLVLGGFILRSFGTIQSDKKGF